MELTHFGWVIAGSKYAADDLVRQACGSSLIGVRRFDFRELVRELSADLMLRRGLTPLTRIARESVASLISGKVALGYLRDVVAFPGFARALARTLRDLRLDRITPERLISTGRSGPDLALLLEAYDRELATRRFADYPAMVNLAIEQVRTMELRNAFTLDLDVRTAAERELLDALGATPIFRPAPEASDCLRAVQRFALSGCPAPARDADPTVTLVSASSESLECVDIARRILHAGVPFDEIAVLLRNPSGYGPMLREAFDRAGIPAYFAGGAEKPNQAGRAFLTLLRCKTERYSAARFAEYLSLGQVPREEEQSLPVSRWDRLLRESGVIAGADRWESRLSAALERALESYREEPQEFLAKDIGALESLRGFALPLIGKLQALPEAGVWREWIDTLSDLAAASLRDPQPVYALLDEIAPVGDLGPVSLEDVVRLLSAHLLTRYKPETGLRYGKVFVADIEQARGMQFRLVFVPGLNEGAFPRPVREDPLLLDGQRRALGMEESRDDGHLLKVAAGAATGSAVFSWTRLELATGRERVPSFFAVEVIKSALGSSADVRSVLDAARCRSETAIGWSAPMDAADSIDDAEYDLASFRAAAAARNQGGCAWLTSQNPHTARAIRFRQSRWARDWSYADGLNDPAVTLAGWRLQERPWSASALEKFARCPYQFYLSAIAGLRPLEAPEALGRMDPLVRGQLFHRTVFHLFREGSEDALSRVDGILREQAAILEAEHAPVIPAVWAKDVAKLRADLRAWLAGRDETRTPVHVELEFNPVTIEGGYKLRGAIDLVEKDSAGRLRIVDHKTGRRPEKAPEAIGFGEILQPMIYALAAEAMLGETPSEAVLSYATLRENFEEYRVPVNFDTRAKLARVLGAIDRWIDQAFLPAAPRLDACCQCDYRPVCGPYEEMRTHGKSEPELHDLTEIRSRA